ncbi:MAG TPA: redox-sensing transcriptional repressor Rex [Clostridiales bacterium]|nr:MAG: Redox-sensing transcriptional repressor Rex [Firmicutes bacterium ADurb.Bin262]HOU10740.1 redox-sensing transcriptional repressor Rex [Clostridiales bacterium]HQH62219.1 redox-sensing transcriptional repressor Rex [Clostridiales bacterium]HQK72150.1 redox-sensing transcriptional repressor Rex [Clostridiales bacterium]
MDNAIFDSGLQRRLNLYLCCLRQLPQGTAVVRPAHIASALLLEPKLVRQDMKTLLCSERVEEINLDALYSAIARYTQAGKVNTVVLVGVGKIGSALMSYSGFSVYHLDIMAGFDINEKVIRKGAYGKPVYHIEKLDTICRQLNAKIGIITTPGGCAQAVCDSLVNCGIVAIWNFSAVRLKAPSHVLIHNEDMSLSLKRLAEHAKLY